MIDGDDNELNLCAELVTLRDCDAFPLALFNDYQAGEWVRVEALCQKTAIALAGTKADLFTPWLPDPHGVQNYAIIVFYNDATKASFAAQYNKARLFGT